MRHLPRRPPADAAPVSDSDSGTAERGRVARQGIPQAVAAVQGRARRRIDESFERFSISRTVKYATWVMAVVTVVAVTTLPAYANPTSIGLGAFSVFDVPDSRGIHVSQYELSLDTGGITAPLKIWLSMRLNGAWNIYRYSIAFVAFLVDWTINMSWVSAITDPLAKIGQELRSQLLDPAGIAAFMLIVSAAVGVVRLIFGRMGKGLYDILSACIVAALVTGVLASPIGAMTGVPLTRARQIGVGVANLIATDGALPEMGGQAPTSHLEVGTTLIDTMIRPPHGLINYGVNFTNDQKCTGAYDKALKAGPYWDPDSTEARQAVGSCDKNLGTYAKYSIYTASASMSLFMVSGALLCALILLVCVLIFIAVLMLVWNLLKLVVTAVIGIGPGDTRGPMIRNAFQALISLIYVASSMIALAIVMAIVRMAFASQDAVPILRFIVADLVLIGGFVIVIQTWIAHRKGAESWAQKVMAAAKQSVPKPTIGSKVGGWLSGPVGGQASVYGDAGGYGGFAGGGGRYGGGGGGGGYGGGARTLTGTGMMAARMLRPVTNSNAFALARIAGAGVATGGVGAVAGVAAVASGTAGQAALVAKGAKAGAKGVAAGAKGVAAGARVANTVRHTYAANRGGAKHAGTGTPRLDTAVDRASRAHQWLETKAVQTHHQGVDIVDRTAQKVRADAPGAVFGAVSGLIGPKLSQPSPAPQNTRSQAHTAPAAPGKSAPQPGPTAGRAGTTAGTTAGKVIRPPAAAEPAGSSRMINVPFLAPGRPSGSASSPATSPPPAQNPSQKPSPASRRAPRSSKRLSQPRTGGSDKPAGQSTAADRIMGLIDPDHR